MKTWLLMLMTKTRVMTVREKRRRRRSWRCRSCALWRRTCLHRAKARHPRHGKHPYWRSATPEVTLRAMARIAGCWVTLPPPSLW